MAKIARISKRKTPEEATALDKQIRMYFNFLRLEKGLSQHSLHSYRFDLTKYSVFLTGVNIDSARAVTEAHLGKFLVTLSDQRLSASSVARILSAVRGFHRFLVGEGIHDDDPTDNIDAPKRSKHLPGVLSIAEIELILKQPDTREQLGRRDRAILEVLYATGVRVSELTSLKQSDLMFDSDLILVFGKGSKERLVPIGS